MDAYTQQGSSFIEVLVALALLMVAGVGMAMVQQETQFVQQQTLWRWQAQHWFEVFAHWQSLGPQSQLGAGHLCEQEALVPPCDSAQCNFQDVQTWQQQRFCDLLRQTLPEVSVLIKPCGEAMCLVMANSRVTAQQCRLGEGHCFMKVLPRGRHG